MPLILNECNLATVAAIAQGGQCSLNGRVFAPHPIENFVHLQAISILEYFLKSICHEANSTLVQTRKIKKKGFTYVKSTKNISEIQTRTINTCELE